jgi:lipoprotein-anchoring transpeptidase ErfK/SrfK
VYGPYAYPLSGHSEVLTRFNGGDGELGIHGNNDASVLGQSVTAGCIGCIRMTNDGITRLASILPLGTPVEIVA